MDSLSLLTFLLLGATVIGLYYRKNNGLIKRKKRLKLSPTEFGGAYGRRATILQFSTTFCSSCRAAKALIKDVVKDEADISYYEVDAESNLELVRKVDVRSTPTTLFLDRSGFEIARATGTPKRDQLIKVVASL
jgi:thiol-disulfide isomerase/thioredoxin